MIDRQVRNIVSLLCSVSLSLPMQVVGMNWIEVPAGQYTLINQPKSHCQIEISLRSVESSSFGFTVPDVM